MAYVDTKDIYKLFEKGVANLHVSDIDVLPRADVVEVKHGEWITESRNGSEEVCRCSVCGKKISFFGFYKAKYCDCGAKMDGGVIHNG